MDPLTDIASSYKQTAGKHEEVVSGQRSGRPKGGQVGRRNWQQKAVAASVADTLSVGGDTPRSRTGSLQEGGEGSRAGDVMLFLSRYDSPHPSLSLICHQNQVTETTDACIFASNSI
jgi:hypothetical protein